MIKRTNHAANAWFGDGYVNNYDSSLAENYHKNAEVEWTLPNMLAGSYSI